MGLDRPSPGLTLITYDTALATTNPLSASKPKEDIGELSFTLFEDPLDPGNLSIGQSEVSLSNLDLEAELQKVLNLPQSDNKDDVPRLTDLVPRNVSFSTSTPPPLTPPLSFVTSGSSNVSVVEQVVQREGTPPLHIHIPSSRMSPLPTPPIGTISHPTSPLGVTLQYSSASPTAVNMRRRSDTPLNLSSRLSGSPALRSASPSVRTGSPLREIASAQELQNGRTVRSRISREDVHMRLMRKRSMESPLGSPAPGSPAPPAEPLVTEKADETMVDEQSDVSVDVGEPDKEDDRCLDMASGVIDLSAELATIQTAEKRTLNSANVSTNGPEDVIEHHEEDTRDGDVSPPADDHSLPTRSSIADPLQLRSTPPRPYSSFGMLESSFDLSGGLGMRDSMGSIQLGEMRSALDRLMDDVKGSSGSSSKKPNASSQVRVELVTRGINAGQFSANTSSNIGDDSMQTATDMDLSMDDFRSAPIVQPARSAPLPIQRAATDSVVYSGPSFRSPVDEEPATPASPTKDAIRAREQLILEKRRQARKRDQEESVDYYTPPRPMSMPPSSGRPSRRRSRSTGDAGPLTKSDLLLDIGISDTEEELLADSISKELRRLDPEHRPGVSNFRRTEKLSR